jgi:signal transduction histidine kinase
MKNIDYPKELRKMYVGNYNMVIIHDAADEIERLQNQINGWEERFNEVCKERDDARIRYCRQQAAIVKGMATPEQVANNLDWDCYKEDLKAEQEKIKGKDA